MPLYFSGRWCDPRQPGHGIRAEEVFRVGANLVHRPLTFEHQGIIAASEAVYNANGGSIHADEVKAELQAAENHIERPVGSVIAADAAGKFVGELDQQLYPYTAAAIQSGKLSVSLTHWDSKNGPAPLELSLCSEPAREAAAVTGTYKGSRLPNVITAKLLTMASEEAQQPVPEVTSLEAALAQLPEDARAAVSEKLAGYETSLGSKEAALAELQKQMESKDARIQQFQEAQEVDEEIFRRLVQGTLERATELNPECTSELGAPDLEALKFDPAARLNVQRLVTACSRAMAAKKPAPPPPQPSVSVEETPAKRSRAAPGTTSSDALIKALHRQFD